MGRKKWKFTFFVYIVHWLSKTSRGCTMFDQSCHADIKNHIDSKIKPLGALGDLEDLAMQLALMQSQITKSAPNCIHLHNPCLFIFSADHGVAEEGVSIAPSAVTRTMLMHFLSGKAAINSFSQSQNLELFVVDCGIKSTIETEDPCFISQRLGSGTENILNKPAMRVSAVRDGITLGSRLIKKSIDDGCRLVLIGEMGIGNTTSASAVFSALTGEEVRQCVGRGTGISDDAYEKKCLIVEQIVKRCKDKSPVDILAEAGGFEIVQMIGAIIAASERHIPVLIDGFIVSVAAYAACQIKPECRHYMVFSHKSHETPHALVLKKLNAKPLLDLSLRLGEGTGAALALPLLHSAAAFYNTMATFEDAGISI